MAITIKKVSTKRELKKFIRFNYRMYKGNPYSVPDLYDDMLNTFNKKKNAAFEFCEADYFKGEVPMYGQSTETAIRAGVIRGMEFEMSGYITHLQKNYPELLVFLTGGDEFSFDTKLKSIIFADRFLVLKGLNRILSYNDKL